MRNILAQYFLSKYFIIIIIIIIIIILQWTTPWWTHIFCFFPSPPPLYPRGSITVSCHLLSLLQKLTRNPNRPLKGRALLNRAIYSYGQLSSKLCQIHFHAGKTSHCSSQVQRSHARKFPAVRSSLQYLSSVSKTGEFCSWNTVFKTAETGKKGKWCWSIGNLIITVM